MRRMRGFLPLAALLLGGCTLLGAPSKVKQGELFEAGEPKYDAYFKDVHDLQVSSVGWQDERRASCRPLVDALKLAPDAADVSIVQGAHERIAAVARDVGPTKLEVTGDDVHLTAGNPGKADDETRELFKAVETCAHAEVARAKSLKDVPNKVDTLTKTGRDLEPHVRDDFIKRGGRAAQSVQTELTASYEVLSNISKSARIDARAAEDFVADLQRGVVVEPGEGATGHERDETAKAPPPPKSTGGHHETTHESHADSKPPPAKPPPSKPSTSSSSSDDTSKPKPKPKPADTGEVFNP